MQVGAPAIIAQRYVYAGMLIGISMMTAVLWMPATLGALAQGYGLGAGELSKLAFTELAGLLLGTLLTSNKAVNSLKIRVLGGCILGLIANAWVKAHNGYPPSSMVRLIAGLGAGIGFGYGLKACAASIRPTRSFGVFTGLMSLVMIIGFQSIAHMLGAKLGSPAPIDPQLVKLSVKSIFEIHATTGLFAGLVLLANPLPASANGSAAVAPKRGLPTPLVLIGLLAIGLAFIGQGAIWAFLQLLGTSHGYSIGAVADAMSAFAIAGIVGSFSAAIAPHRWPRWPAMSAALLLLWCGLYAMYAPSSFNWYVVGSAIGGYYWNFVLPLMLGLLARVDLSGQGAVLGGAMSSLGSALGPLLAAQLIRNDNYRPVGWMGGAVCLAGFICISLVERRAASN